MGLLCSVFIGDTVFFSGDGILDSSGTNSRTYHAFQCEDYVGRISDLAVMCNKGKLEEAILPRYYMGFLKLNIEGILSPCSLSMP